MQLGRLFSHISQRDLDDHSFSILMCYMGLSFAVSGGITPAGYWRDLFLGLCGGSWACVVLVLAQAHTYERGATPVDQPPPDLTEGNGHDDRQ